MTTISHASRRAVSALAAMTIVVSVLVASPGYAMPVAAPAPSQDSSSWRAKLIPVDCLAMADDNVGRSWKAFHTTFVKACKAIAAGDVEKLIRMCGTYCDSEMDAIFRKSWSSRSFRVQMLQAMSTEPAGADVQSFPTIQNVDWAQLSPEYQRHVATTLNLRTPENPPKGYVPNYKGPVVVFIYGPKEFTFLGTMRFRHEVNGVMCTWPDDPSIACAR